MRNFWTYTFLLLAALTGGAFLWGLVAAWGLPEAPHHKLVKYGALLTAAVVLTLWARRRVSRATLGLADSAPALLRQGAGAFAATVLLLLPLWVFLLLADLRAIEADVHATEIAARMAGYLALALAVSVFEELYFRGLLLSGAARFAAPLAASALLYAGLHFLTPAADPSLAGQWDGGLRLLGAAALDLPAESWEQTQRLALLIVIGLGLGALRLRFQRLALCIGVHAGMVFSLKLFQYATEPGAGAAPAWLGTDPLGGWAGALWIAIVFFLFGLIFSFSKIARGQN